MCSAGAVSYSAWREPCSSSGRRSSACSTASTSIGNLHFLVGVFLLTIGFNVILLGLLAELIVRTSQLPGKARVHRPRPTEFRRRDVVPAVAGTRPHHVWHLRHGQPRTRRSRDARADDARSPPSWARRRRLLHGGRFAGDVSAGLGFRSLAIIDLETNNESMRNEDGTIRLVFTCRLPDVVSRVAAADVG